MTASESIGTSAPAAAGRWTPLLPLIPLAWLVFALISSAFSNSVTVDEFQHLPAGVLYWQDGDVSFNRFNPPLIRALAAAPLVATGSVRAPDVSVEDNRWRAGLEFQASLGRGYHDAFVRARLVMALLTLLTALLIYQVALRLLEPVAALAALTLFCFHPMVLAHGAVVTTDSGFSLAFLATLVAAARFFRDPDWTSTGALGLVLGLALLAKFTALLLPPLLLAGALILQFTRLFPDIGWRGQSSAARWRLVAAASALALVVVDAGYLFQGIGQPLAGHTFTHPLLQYLSGTFIGRIPLPLPGDFISGFDLQHEQSANMFAGYFMGNVTHDGWWYYYPVALFLKAPIAFSLLMVALLVAIATRRLPLTPSLTAALGVPIVGTVLFSVLTGINIGVRYLLFLVPFLCMAIAHLWCAAGARQHLRALSLCLAGYAFSVAVCHPNYIGYFSEIVGGSTQGHKYLADSNLDWGQDLIRLRDYMREQRIESVALSNFGLVDARVYGIDHKSVQAAATGDTVVISINHLLGLDPWSQASGVERYRNQVPKARIGTSLWVFDAIAD